jgi:GntR family transcriptional regulator
MHSVTIPHMFTLNPNSGVPIYRQLLEQVRRMVASGQLRAGTQLPSIRDLAVKHAVNPMTVSKAYSLLEAEGLLERNRGKPMTVTSHRGGSSLPAKRMCQLEPHLDQLILAAHQLELSMTDVIKTLRLKWEETNEEPARRRTPAG